MPMPIVDLEAIPQVALQFSTSGSTSDARPGTKARFVAHIQSMDAITAQFVTMRRGG
jgi:hypothetical protein